MFRVTSQYDKGGEEIIAMFQSREDAHEYFTDLLLKNFVDGEIRWLSDVRLRRYRIRGYGSRVLCCFSYEGGRHGG
jgi:hypothetical protein